MLRVEKFEHDCVYQIDTVTLSNGFVYKSKPNTTYKKALSFYIQSDIHLKEFEKYFDIT
jgi:hypothetical protein